MNCATAKKSKPLFVGSRRMATISGLPEAFLKAEADRGELPSLKIKKRRFFAPELVKEALLKKASNEAPFSLS